MARIIKILITTMLFSLVLIVSQTGAQEGDTENSENLKPKNIEVYSAPKPIKRQSPAYPLNSRRNLEEGWVDVSYMVDTSGQVFEPTITDTSHGGSPFIKSVLKALEESTFKPAELDGKPVDASMKMRYRFSMQNSPTGTSSRSFLRRYKKFTEALKENKQEEAKNILDQMVNNNTRNLYDDTYLNLALYFYEKNYGSKPQQLHYLSRTVASDSTQAKYLGNEYYKRVSLELINLQLEQKHYGEALETYERLSRLEGTYEMLTNLESMVDSIEELAINNQQYDVVGRLDDDGDWWLVLLKSGFSFNVVKGNIEEIKLRCSKKYVFFEYIGDKDYHIPKSYGDCDINVIGTPDTAFNLTQFSAIKLQAQ